MGPLLRILRKKLLRDDSIFSKEAVNALLNIGDRTLMMRDKDGKSNRYIIKGTIFSGFWGTYLFNTMIIAT